MLKVFIAGQKSFGAAVYKAVRNEGHTVTGVACPADGQYFDRLKKSAYCDAPRPVIIDDEQLRASDIPDGTDAIIAAHSHHFISTKAREKVRYAFGYHPSLLPRHRGKDAVKWTIRFGDAVAGGSIYELGEKVDGGAIVLQRSVLVKKEWTYKDLWREALFPLGVQLILETLKMIEDGKYSAIPQDESLATWEPPIEPNTRLLRPELIMLGGN
ncbi:MAG: formyltransferase family protein [Treponema sp.]